MTSISLPAIPVQAPSKIIESEIVETCDITDLIKFARTRGTLLLCDIDLSLMKPKTAIGGYPLNAWMRKKTCTKLQVDKRIAIAKIEPLSQLLDKLGSQELMDTRIPNLLGFLQKRGVSVLGCTARKSAYAAQTLEHLKKLGVSFSANLKIPARMSIEDGAILADRVIFAGSDIDKGSASEEFLKRTKLLFERIVLLDDKFFNHLTMQAACKRMGIHFAGVQYTASKGADDIVLSDSEATEALKTIIEGDAHLQSEYGYLLT